MEIPTVSRPGGYACYGCCCISGSCEPVILYLEPDDVEALQAPVDYPAEVLQAVAACRFAYIEYTLVRDRLKALVAGKREQTIFGDRRY